MYLFFEILEAFSKDSEDSKASYRTHKETQGESLVTTRYLGHWIRLQNAHTDRSVAQCVEKNRCAGSNALKRSIQPGPFTDCPPRYVDSSSLTIDPNLLLTLPNDHAITPEVSVCLCENISYATLAKLNARAEGSVRVASYHCSSCHCGSLASSQRSPGEQGESKFVFNKLFLLINCFHIASS